MLSPITKTLVTIICLTAIAIPSDADELIIAPQEAPMYRVNKLRMERDEFGSSVLVADYKRTRKGTMGQHRVRIAGKTKSGELRVLGFGGIKESGVLRISVGGMLMTDNDFEVYFVLSAPGGKQFLVSNVARLGNPGPATRARNMTAEEKQAMEKAKLAATPPKDLPTGFDPVTIQTKLLPGMPIKAGRSGQWTDAEVIGVNAAGPVRVRYIDENRIVQLKRKKWLAIDNETLAKGESNPDQFKPSVKTLPDSLQIIPAGAIPLADDVDLPPGTPLLLDYHGMKWHLVYAINSDSQHVTLRYDGYGANWDESKPRSKILITEETLKKLKVPAEVEKFAKNIAGEPAGAGTSFPHSRTSNRTIRHKRYPINIAVPKGAQFVPDDLKVEEGTPLAGCWARKWHPITVIHENDDGSIYVHWDEFSDGFNCNMVRSELIIEDKTVKVIRKKMEQSSAAPDTNSQSSQAELQKTLRTWIDASGAHKIEAYYVSHSETQVTLKTDAGREINLPLEKLSEKDQALLHGLKPASENPFSQ